MGARLPLYRQCVRPLHWHGAELARWVATGYVLAAAGSLRIINQDITFTWYECMLASSCLS